MNKPVKVTCFKQVHNIVTAAAQCRQEISVQDLKGAVADAKSILGLMNLISLSLWRSSARIPPRWSTSTTPCVIDRSKKAAPGCALCAQPGVVFCHCGSDGPFAPRFFAAAACS